MKKIISLEKRVDFPSMIGEICEINLEHELKFIDEVNISGDLILSGKYKSTEASVIEEDFEYRFPVEVCLTLNIDLNTADISISDFYYEIENDNVMKCYIDIKIEGVELIEVEDDFIRECDGDVENKEIEIPHIETNEKVNNKEVEEKENKVNKVNILSNVVDDEKYGTFIVYIVRQNETVNSILEKYNSSLEELEKYNDLKELGVGSKIIIPILDNN